MFTDEVKKSKQEELNLVPMMNLMTVLIPFLLSITAFSKIAIIEIALPKDRGSTREIVEDKKPKKSEKIDLTILVSDQGLTIGAKGGFLPTILTREKWVFKDEKSGNNYTVLVDSSMRKEMRKNRSIKVKEAGRFMTMFERQRIVLSAINDENGVESLVKSVHNSAGDLIVKTDFSPVLMSELQVGQKVVNLKKYIQYNKLMAMLNSVKDELDTNVNVPKSLKISKEKEMQTYQAKIEQMTFYERIVDLSAYSEQSVSAYDILLTELLQVRQRYEDARDREEIIVTCEDKIVYEKIVNILDIAMVAGFTKIQMAKFRV